MDQMPRPQGFGGSRHHAWRNQKGLLEELSSSLRDKTAPEREPWEPAAEGLLDEAHVAGELSYSPDSEGVGGGGGEEGLSVAS